MKVKQLKKILDSIDDDKLVYVQGEAGLFPPNIFIDEYEDVIIEPKETNIND